MPGLLSWLRIVGLWCLLAEAWASAPVAAAAPATPDDRQAAIRREVTELVKDLDSSRYELRQRAAQRLEDLVGRPELGPLLAAEFQRLSVRPDVSFEVRWRVNRWRTRLPKVSADPPPAASSAELDQLIQQLDDDSYTVRLGAVDRLKWLSGNPRLAGSLLARLKQRLASPNVSAEACRRFEAVRQSIWGTWLMSDPADWDVPPVSPAQLQRWIEELARLGPTSQRSGPWERQQIARQELMDLLAQDAEVPRVKAALEAGIRESTDPQAATRLQELLDWTRPAMVAEYWRGRKNLGQQHLLVGVPSLAAGAMRPSHFDRIDDRVAHCVSGNSLSPGDYAVGVAFPHPQQAEAFFHLVNLPTPRRRMAYTYYVKTDVAERLAAVSRRTLDRFLAEKHLLDEAEIAMLGQLDPKEMSIFASRYFGGVEDALLDEAPQQPPWAGRSRLAGQSSRLGMICVQLAIDGTHDAAPGLLDAIRRKKFLPPTSLGPYWTPWLAALAIASRDPWEGVDAWLVGIVGRSDLLVEGRAEGPELGATAARILLRRHHELPGPFDLEPVADSVMANLGIEGYRFQSSEGPRLILTWWNRRTESTPRLDSGKLGGLNRE